MTLFTLIFGGIWSPVLAEEEGLPLWEAGMGVGVVRFPDYRGSDEGRTYILPTPYLVYRGGRVRVDRRGVRGALFETEDVSLNVSVSLGPPARSGRNEARAGMPDLDPTFEIGPSLNIRLYDSATEDRLLTLRLPTRAVFATDFRHAESVGVVFLPHVAYDFLHVGPGHGWNLGLSAGLIYATDKHHEYYYAVRPEFATPTRPAYEARGGYSGASVGLTLSKRLPDYWFGLFVRYDDLHGAVFDDSPLVRTKGYLVGGIAFIKVFARSSTRVGPRDTELDP